jgi:dipeptide transport system permease protein
MSAISNTSTSIRAQQWQEFWFYFSASKTAVAGLIFLILVILMALFADVISPHGPAEQFREFAKLPPAWMEDGQLQFFLGTDYAGRDMLSRIIHGSRLSLLAGCVVVVLSMSIGVLLGLIAGYRGGWIETLIMRVMDTIMAVPGLLLALVLVAILGPGLLNAMVAIAITYTPSFVRLTRASTLIELNRDYVTASKVAGAGPARLMFISILPNCMAPIIVQGTLSFSTAILDTAALGFLGMGAQAPIPEWGTLIAENRDLIMSAPWTVTFPGIAILLAVLMLALQS